MQNSVIIYSPETKTFTSQKKERYMRLKHGVKDDRIFIFERTIPLNFNEFSFLSELSL